MSDRARGGLFNTLGDISGLTVLDTFAGSGALGFEAVSRGADSVRMLESDHAAQAAITKSIADLDLTSQIKLVKATAQAWLTTSDDRFDLVLLDPPYDDLQPKLLEKLAARARPGGLVVYSLPPSTELAVTADYELLTTKEYGDAQLVFYRRVVAT